MSRERFPLDKQKGFHAANLILAQEALIIKVTSHSYTSPKGE